VTFRSLQRAAHSAEVNCGPLSLVIVDGTPNHCIQPVNSAAAQSAAAAEEFEAAIQQHIQQAVAAALAGMPQPTSPTRPTVNVNAVAVKLPEFWPADPQTWFHQAEAAFADPMSPCRTQNTTTSS
jgi:hypothetical protein